MCWPSRKSDRRRVQAAAGWAAREPVGWAAAGWVAREAAGLVVAGWAARAASGWAVAAGAVAGWVVAVGAAEDWEAAGWEADSEEPDWAAEGWVEEKVASAVRLEKADQGAPEGSLAMEVGRAAEVATQKRCARKGAPI